jgi:ABC-type sugar transport system ATPase subunit
MNFLPGAVADGAFHVAGCGLRLPLGASVAPAGPAVLGIRPEDFRLAAAGDGIPFATVMLDIAEHLGHETLAHFTLPRAESDTWIARLPGDAPLQAGDRVELAVRPDALHFFAADDGQRLN